MTGSEEGFEGAYDSVADRLKQGLQDLANRFPPARLGLIERYERGQLEIHVHLLGRISFNKGECCVLFQRVKGGYSTHFDHSDSPTTLTHCTGSSGARKQGEERSAMFVDVPKLVEDPEGIRIEYAVRSLVWLRSIEQCPGTGADAPHNIGEDRASLAIRPGNLKNGELRSTGTGDRNSLIENDELPSEVVQCRPEVVEDVSHHGSQEWWDWLQFSDDDNTVVFGIRLEVGAKAVRLGVDKSLRETI